MNFTRFFVTAVLLVGTVISMGCGNKKQRKSDPLQTASFNSEVKDKWDDTDLLGKELAQTYQIRILDYPYRDNKVWIDSKLAGQKFNWNRLTRAERQAAKEKLARYVTDVSRIIEIDSKRGVYVTNMDKVRSRYQGALAFQESLSRFEETVGEQFESKSAGQGPAYFPPVAL